jgi:hypothetical protein
MKNSYSKLEKLWAQESQKRYAIMVSGKVPGIPAAKVFQDIRSKLEFVIPRSSANRRGLRRGILVHVRLI